MTSSALALMTSKLSLAGLLAFAGLTAACTLDPASFEPRPSELAGQSWADQTSRHVWAVLPEPPRWKKDITREAIKGTAVVVGEGQFLTACALIADENAVGLARVNKYYIAKLVRRINDGSCLLAAANAPINLPIWRRAKPSSTIAEPVILVSMSGVRDIEAQTATLLGGTFRGEVGDPTRPAIAFDRFGAVIGLAAVAGEGRQQLIGNEALRFGDLVRLEPEAPLRDDRPDAQFSVVATPEIAAPEPRPTTIAFAAEPGRQENDDDSTFADQPSSSESRTQQSDRPASTATVDRDQQDVREAKGSKSGKSKGAKNRDRRDREARNKDRKNRDRNGRGKRDRSGKHDKDDRRDRESKKDRDDRKGRGGRRGRDRKDDD